jgi:hypothetical protein
MDIAIDVSQPTHRPTGGDTGARGIPRLFSEVDKFTGRSILSEHAGARLRISSIRDDAEARDFAEQVRDLLVNAGWSVPPVGQSDETIIGLTARLPSGGPDGRAASEFVDWLGGMGVDLVKSEDPERATPDLVVGCR